jgi:hypothetical protein
LPFLAVQHPWAGSAEPPDPGCPDAPSSSRSDQILFPLRFR